MEQHDGNAKSYRFTVDGKSFDSPESVITGARLREIARIDPSSNLFLDISQKREHNPDLLIHNSATVNLMEPGKETFYTLQRPSMDIY